MMAEQTSATTATPTPVATRSTDKSLKRKLEDALQTLDEAVGPIPSQSTTSRPPLKRLRTARSIYTMLTKYGIKKDKAATPASDLETLSKTSPNLAKILSRTATRTRKALPLKFNQSGKSFQSNGSSLSDYRPSSMTSFLTRLATYKIATYGNKPSSIDAVAAAKCGWINEGKDRLLCGLCGVSWVLASRDGMTREAANALVEKQRQQLVEAHKDGCPWKTRQCDDSIYHVPLQAPLPMIRELKSRAILLDSVLAGVTIKHPLAAAQVQSLVSIIHSVSLPKSPFTGVLESTTPTEDTISASVSTGPMPEAQPSETAILTALFGWSILPPVSQESMLPPSASRAGSLMPGTPSRGPSRASSVVRESTPTPSSPRSSIHLSPSTSLLSQYSTSSAPLNANTTLLHCPLCQRRVGLWAFLPKPTDRDDPMDGTGETNKKEQAVRPLDILREHRSYCPYVVRSTVLPSLPAPSPTSAQAQKGHERSASLASLASTNGSTIQINAQPGAVEGWRAVMAVISRYGNVQRQRLGLNRVRSGRFDSVTEGGEEGNAEEDPIQAMVADVKSHGGKDLLKYVKGLLG